MYKTEKEIIDNIDLIMSQALRIAEGREYGLGILRVYYAGGTLCLDIYNGSQNNFLVMVNINGEQFYVDKSGGESVSRLLPINSLKLAFDIYEMVKGQTAYLVDCREKSCIRHFN